MNAARLEAFSDGVFSIAFTLLILDFHAPETTSDLFGHLIALWPQFLGYGISFLLIGLIWANHRAMFQHMARLDRMSVFLNTLLLADVAFLPFPTSVLAKAIASQQGLAEAAFFYGLVLTIGGFAFNALWLYGASPSKAGGKDPVRQHIRRISLRFLAGPLAYLVATLCAFVSPWLSVGLYVTLIIFFWLPGRLEQPAQSPARPARRK